MNPNYNNNMNYIPNHSSSANRTSQYHHQQPRQQQHQAQRSSNIQQNPSALRPGLSVQELKEITARRIAMQKNTNDNLTISTTSYQTATPQELQAAGIQPLIHIPRTSQHITTSSATIPSLHSTNISQQNGLNKMKHSGTSTYAYANQSNISHRNNPSIGTYQPKNIQVEDIKELTKMRLLTERETFFEDPLVYSKQSTYPNTFSNDSNILNSHKSNQQVSQSTYFNMNDNDNDMISSQYMNQSSSSLLNNTDNNILRKNGNSIQPMPFHTNNRPLYSPATIENPSISDQLKVPMEVQSYYNNKPSSATSSSSVLAVEQQQYPRQFHRDNRSMNPVNPIVYRPNSSSLMNHNSDVSLHDHKQKNIYGRISPLVDYHNQPIQQIRANHFDGNNIINPSKLPLYKESLSYDDNNRPIDVRNRMYDHRVIEQEMARRDTNQSSLGSMFDCNESHTDYVSQRMAPNHHDFASQRQFQHFDNDFQDPMLNFNQSNYDRNEEKHDIHQQISTRSTVISDYISRQSNNKEQFTSSNNSISSNEYVRQGMLPLNIDHHTQSNISQRPYRLETSRIASFSNENTSFNSGMNDNNGNNDIDQQYALSEHNHSNNNSSNTMQLYNDSNNNSSNTMQLYNDNPAISSRRPSTSLYNAAVDMLREDVTSESVPTIQSYNHNSNMLDLSFLSPQYKQYQDNIATSNSTNTSSQYIENDHVNFRKSFNNSLASNSPPILIDSSSPTEKLVQTKSNSRLVLPSMNNLTTTSTNTSNTNHATTLSSSPCESPKLLILSRKNSENSPNNSTFPPGLSQQQQQLPSYLNARNRTVSESSSVGSLFELVADLVLDQSSHSNSSSTNMNLNNNTTTTTTATNNNLTTTNTTTNTKNNYIKTTNAFMNIAMKNKTINVEEDGLLSKASSFNSNFNINNDIISRENSSNSILSESFE